MVSTTLLSFGIRVTGPNFPSQVRLPCLSEASPLPFSLGSLKSFRDPFSGFLCTACIGAAPGRPEEVASILFARETYPPCLVLPLVDGMSHRHLTALGSTSMSVMMSNTNYSGCVDLSSRRRMPKKTLHLLRRRPNLREPPQINRSTNNSQRTSILGLSPICFARIDCRPPSILAVSGGQIRAPGGRIERLPRCTGPDWQPEFAQILVVWEFFVDLSA